MIDRSDENWMAISSYHLNNVARTLVLDCNYEVGLVDLRGLPEFYIDILKAWSEIKDECMPEDYLQIQDEVLWNNKNITITEKSIYYKDWHVAGIEKLEDLSKIENKFMSYQSVIQKLGRQFPFTNCSD